MSENDIVTILRDISNDPKVEEDIAEACRDGAKEIERLRTPNKSVAIGEEHDTGYDEWWCSWLWCPKCGRSRIARCFSFCPDCGAKLQRKGDVK